MSTPRLLDPVRSVKVKLGLLILASVTVAILVGALGRDAGVATWILIPVTAALALGVTQLLAVGMTSPLREMTNAAGAMARGDYSARVTATSSDEVGQLARAFNQMASDLEAVDRQRRELVANVSHELRTPLTALCALLENLADGVSPASPDTLHTALQQAERLSALAADLLDLARVDAGRTPLSVAPVDVAALLADATAEARVNTEHTGRNVTFHARVPAGLLVDVDAARLRQLVANLLDNASRHSPAGGTVTVAAAVDGDVWTLDFTDDGPGVAPADRARVFERFGTLADPTSGDGTGGGTGLGLAIARWVTDLHGGTIAFVDPPSGRGAHVRVTLPTTPRATATPDRAAIRPEEVTVVSTSSTDGHSSTDAPPPATGTRLPTWPAVPSGPPTRPEPAMDALFGRFWPEGGLAPRITAVVAAFGVGLLAALVVPDRHLGIGTSAVLLAGGAAVLAFARHRRTPYTLGCAALCALLALVPLLRDAEWIAVLAALAGASVCIAGLTHGRGVGGILLSGLSWPLAGLRGIPWLGRTLGSLGNLGHGPAILRTALWSVLGLVVFGALFASADAVFAEWTDTLVPDLGFDMVVARIFLIVFVGSVVLAAAYLGMNPPRVDSDRPARPVAHRFEWLAPVLLVDVVVLAFLAAQATVVFGGHDYLQRTTGLTYAEYVHQGFGQLTVATLLTLLVVGVAARKARRASVADRAWLRGSLGLLCAATLVVVASALYRMHLYQEAYGFTRLRLLVDVFEGWLGFLVIAILVAGIRLRGAWIPRTALLTGAGLVLGIALMNPDGWIARHNLDRFEETGKVDWYYLQGLSGDAVPVFADLPSPERECALGDGGNHNPADRDWLEWNLGWQRALPTIEEGSALSLVPDCSTDTRGLVVDMP